MNNSRTKLYMSISLTALLIIQVVLFFLFKNDGWDGMVIILLIMVLLAIFAVVINIVAIRRTENRVKNLPKDYRSFYMDASEAIGMSSMKKLDKRANIDMILEILEHANEDNRTLSSVIGNDSAAYLQNFINASGGQLTPLYLFGYSLSAFFLYLFMLKIYKVFRDGDGSLASLKSQPLDMGIVLTYALIAFIFLPWLLLALEASSKNQWHGLKKIWILLPFSIPMLLMIGLIFIDSPSLRVFLDKPLPIMSNIYLIGLSLCLTIVGFFIAQYAKKRNLRKSMND